MRWPWHRPDATAPSERHPELRAHPELAAAIDSGRASFDVYVRARVLAGEGSDTDDASRELFRAWRSKLLGAYENESGRILGSFYCKHLVGAAARTDRPRFALVFNSHTWGKEEALLTQCDGLYWEGIDYLAGTDRVTFVERLYAVATDVLALLDARCTPQERVDADESALDGTLHEQAIAALNGKLEAVRKFHAQAAPKRARLRYLAGVVLGLVASLAVALLLLLLLVESGVVPAGDRTQIVTVWLAGAIGAVVSVMQRVSADNLKLHHEAGRFELFLLGTVRPLLGGAVAVALYCLIAGGILDFAAPRDAAREIYFFAGLGFLSGFSERFAQDMLVRTDTRFSIAERSEPRRVDQGAHSSLATGS